MCLGTGAALNTAFIERVNLTVRDARGSSGKTYLVHSPTVSSTLGSRGMVAGQLSFRAPPQSAPSGARPTTSARRQTSGATLPTTGSGDGNGENPSTMDGRRGALVPLAVRFRLRD